MTKMPENPKIRAIKWKPTGQTFDIVATDAAHATTADSATTATTATSAGHATTADSATSAGHATTADSATTATNAGHATTADSATTATSADSATTADTATALATKRTIDGSEFNGTANVTHYAICTTAADVADKVVDCDNFKLDYGAMILVKFNYGNTAAISSVRLNVANTGAKSLYYRGANLPDTFSIRSDSVYLFVYHGPRWHLVGDTESVYDFYGTCSTAAATGTKQVTINNFKQQTGSMIVVKFNNTNTAATSSLYLQVNSEASKQIRYKNSSLSYPGMIEEKRLYLFTYDGYGWQLVGNYDYLVDIATLPATTSTATYYPTITSTSGLQSLSMFDSFKYTHTKGTTSAVGNDTITLGNSTASGTASNEEGVVTLYSPGTASHTIKGASTTTNRTHTLPDATGTILNTGNVSVTPIGSTGNKIATINVAGTSSDIYAPPSDVDRYLINIETASEVTNTWADVDTMRSENRLTVIRGGANDTTFYIPEWYAGKHGVGLLMSYTDAKALISFNSNTTDIDDPIPRVTFAAGNYNNGAYESPRWYFSVEGGSGVTYNLDNLLKVTQTNKSNNTEYRLLLSTSATDSTENGTVNKSSGLTYNPSNGMLTVGDGIYSQNYTDNTKVAVIHRGANIWINAILDLDAGTYKHPSGYVNLLAGTSSSNPNKSIMIGVRTSYDSSTGTETTTWYPALHKGITALEFNPPNNATSKNYWSNITANDSYTNISTTLLTSSGTINNPPDWYAGKQAVGLYMNHTSRKAVISLAANDTTPKVMFAAGNSANSTNATPTWYFGLTGVNGTTYDLSTFSTTDTKVTQSNATGNIDRPLMLSHDSTATTSSVTDVLYRNASMYGNPSTGIITATGFNTSTGLNYSSSGTTIPLVTYNSAGNIWVGVKDSTSAMTSSQIYLAAGFDSTNNVPFESVKIAVANSTNTGSSSYEILHKGNTYVNITSETDHWSTVDVPLTSSYVFKVLRGGTGSSAPTPPAWFSEKYGAGIVFGGSDSAGVFSVNRSTPGFTIAGGTHSSTSTKPSWYMNITGTNETTYNLDNFLSTGNTTTQSIGSASAGTAISADDITAWSAGTIPSLTTTTHSVPNITGNTSVTVKSVKTVNTVMTTATISSGVLTFSTGASVVTEDKTASNTTVGTAISIKGVNEWSAGTVPSLSYTSRTIPNISVTTVTNILKKT